uniref:Uncharacterized protein n=1 Tax=Anguilla anguilla TaxID=7936 RepID=A0A0E9QRA9_ANGAN
MCSDLQCSVLLPALGTIVYKKTIKVKMLAEMGAGNSVSSIDQVTSTGQVIM